jgi:hypothetical protein
MKKFGRIIGSAAVLLAASATAAHADLGGLVNGTQYCGGNTFSTCATINTISYSGGTLTLQVTNTSGSATSVFTAIGLANIGGTFTVATFGASGDGSWVQGTSGLSGAGIQSAVIGGEAVAPPPTNGLHDGQTVTFTFTFTGNPDFTDLQLAIHDQGGTGAGGCATSTKLVVTGGVANDPTCGSTTVPEPMTMSLLATGLAGMGGLGAFKRRRK